MMIKDRMALEFFDFLIAAADNFGGELEKIDDFIDAFNREALAHDVVGRRGPSHSASIRRQRRPPT